MPDGPLHLLPFAALVRGDGGGNTSGYLIERWPVTVALSATLHAELAARARRVSADAPAVVVMGAPEGTGEVAGAWSGGRAVAGTLPEARKEIQAVAGLFDNADVFIGASASEAQAKAIRRDSDIVHFASHAVTDHSFPMESYLLLSRSAGSDTGGENGLLQAWEVFEELRIDADLAVLSACDTGLGREMGGEGLIGLTRAFHFAGARSVIASLWPVSDRSTARLMTSFYQRLSAGVSKDEALRQAQLELMRRSGGVYAHPFYWAAFQLSGLRD